MALDAVETSLFQSKSSSADGLGSGGIEPVRPLVVGRTIATSLVTFLQTQHVRGYNLRNK